MGPDGALLGFSFLACRWRAELEDRECRYQLFTPAEAPSGIFRQLALDPQATLAGCGLNLEREVVCWGLPDGFESEPLPGVSLKTLVVANLETSEPRFCGILDNDSLWCWNWAGDAWPQAPGVRITDVALQSGGRYTLCAKGYPEGLDESREEEARCWYSFTDTSPWEERF